MRKLAPYNKNNVSLNFDFIAFGKFNTTRKGKRQLWSSKQLDFLKTIAESGFADGFSLYTLELFEGSEWYHKMIHVNDHEREGFGL